MIYVDESIQTGLGYIATAMVYCATDPEPAVAAALTNAGLTPRLDEYKSGARMQDNTRLHQLRDDLAFILQTQSRIAVLVTPSAERGQLGRYILDALLDMLAANSLPHAQRCFIDEGISLQDSPEHAQLLAAGVELQANSDSRLILGLQLADCAAYHSSFIIKAALSGKQKMLTLGPEAGYPEPIEADLAWVLRTQLRHAYFTAPCLTADGDVNLMPAMLGYGAFLRGTLPLDAAAAVEKEFGHLWVGCVH